MKVKESLNVKFDEIPPSPKTSPLEDDDLVKEESIKVSEKKLLGNDVEDETLEIDEIVNIKESKSRLSKNVIGNLNQRTLRSPAQDKNNFFCFFSTIEPKNVEKALKDESQELSGYLEISLMKMAPSRNKARFVAKGYNQ
nr:hypothetical protein [Tanacetum cinerariifolium]